VAGPDPGISGVGGLRTCRPHGWHLRLNGGRGEERRRDGRFRLHQRGRPRRVARLELAALKADIDTGLADSAAGRVKDFDATRIVGRGRKLLADRSPSV
jgi:hypothetical protein